MLWLKIKSEVTDTSHLKNDDNEEEKYDKVDSRKERLGT